MMDALRYMLRLPLIIYFKIRYLSRVKISFVQAFSLNTSISVRNRGTLEIGRHLQSRRNLQIIADGGHIKIGRSCFFNANCSVTSLDSVCIGKCCSFGNNLVIVDHDHDYKNKAGVRFVTAPVIIGDNVWVGANCVILKGSAVGDNCVIGAGSIVKGSLPDNTLLYQDKKDMIRQL